MKNIHKTVALGLLTASVAFAQPPTTVGDNPWGRNLLIAIGAVVVIVIAIMIVKKKKP